MKPNPDTKRKIIVALKCFIDESADGFGNHTVVMAGYVADDTVWADFDVDWKAELASQKLEFAHFGSKIFNGKKAQRNAERFYRVIEKHLGAAFCVYCKVPDYRAFMARCQFPEGLVKSPKFHWLKDPHMFLYRAFVEMCYYEREKLGITEPIKLVFDDTNKYKRLVSNVYEYFYYSAEKLGIDVKQFGGIPTFEDDERCTALQAADLLARLARKCLVDGKPLLHLPWKKEKEIKLLSVEMGDSYVFQVLTSSLSQQNLDMHSEYGRKRGYALYYCANWALKRLPRFISIRLARFLNNPLHFG